MNNIYCELMTPEEVEEFEEVLIKLGNSEFERPLFYASKPPYWYRKGLERSEGEDPLAAVFLLGGMVLSGRRGGPGTMITTKEMKEVLEFLIDFKKIVQDKTGTQ